MFKFRRRQPPQIPFNENSDLEMVVMPHEEKELEVRSPRFKFRLPSLKKIWEHKVLIIGLVVFLVGSIGGLLVYQKFSARRVAKTALDQNLSKLREIEVPKTEVETRDLDQDGLTDEQEKQYLTSPQKADSDGDGLADSDEVKIYKTDPLLSDTDEDGYDDGREVARGYSPIIKIFQKASPEEIQSWTDRIASFKLHEPTPTTLKLKAADVQNQAKVTYTNALYKYTLELPAILTFREADESRLVGIYVFGTNPEGDVSEDPINVSIAVKVNAQTLKEWATSQYPASDYEFLQERDVNGIHTVRLVGIKNEACPQNKTFYIRDNIIMILTWTCNQNSPFADLYEQIAQSFKYVK